MAFLIPLLTVLGGPRVLKSLAVPLFSWVGVAVRTARDPEVTGEVAGTRVRLPQSEYGALLSFVAWRERGDVQPLVDGAGFQRLLHKGMAADE